MGLGPANDDPDLDTEYSGEYYFILHAFFSMDKRGQNASTTAVTSRPPGVRGPNCATRGAFVLVVSPPQPVLGWGPPLILPYKGQRFTSGAGSHAKYFKLLKGRGPPALESIFGGCCLALGVPQTKAVPRVVDVQGRS